MIITCNNCQKKFDIDTNLIPDKGRLLQCSGCGYKWFFKKETMEAPMTTIMFNEEKTTKLQDDTVKSKTDFTIRDHENEIQNFEEDKAIVEPIQKQKKQKNYKILNLLVVTLVSLVALIIILDTFKSPIGKIVPNIELVLYNLYETLKDISLFIKDLF